MLTELPPILKDDGRGVRFPEEVADALGICGNSIRRAVDRGEIRATKVGVRTFIPLGEVARLLGVTDTAEQLVPAGAGAESL